MVCAIATLTLGVCGLCSAGREAALSEFGTAGRGEDDTAVLQRALIISAARGWTLRIPAPPRPYRVRPLKIPSNTSLVLEKGVIIQAVPGFRTNECLLNLDNVTNVSITGYGATLAMPKAEYTEGEYRHALAIHGSANVTIRGLACTNSGGDGIYISGGDSKPYSENIIIEDVSCNNNRRQGMSIISAQNLLVRRCRFISTNGTAPEDGIDLEPNGPTDRLVNIRIEDCVTSGNKGDGICVSIGQLDNTSADVSITVLRNRDENSGGSGYMASGLEMGEKDVKGRVLIDRCSAERAGMYGAAAIFWESTGPLLTFRDLTVIDPNQSHSAIDNAATIVKRGGGAVGPMGGVHFLNPTIKSTDGKVDYYFTYHDWSQVGIGNVKFVGGTLAGAVHHPYGLFNDKEVTSVDVP
jgi:hypothetical protein